MKPINDLNQSTVRLMPAKSYGRLLHRMICVLSGFLAIFGSILAYTINPWFAVFTIASALGLLLSPEIKV